MNISSTCLFAGASPVTFVSYFSLLISFIAIIVTLIGLSSKLTASLAQNNRQAWINEYREKLSEMIMSIDTLYIDNLSEDQKLALKKRIKTLAYSLELMLNSEEDQELLKLVQDLSQNGYQNGKFANREELIPLSKKMLKNEWERIKDESTISYPIKKFCKENRFLMGIFVTVVTICLIALGKYIF
ncbi:hypothetical protein [Francisella philomiragia]|uniref:Uncharacterized protein n=1 Tax=Francisella philomiragia TaxID=28110 RepID=A0ABS1GC52_9GAMM|nr:hypothetical protein [Francisella philomiragia]MBK2258425.1 hypothetical protein [Francisella philomiragia]MBK2302405.1 hypothetical protein [Francisella philomiragia]